MQNIDQIEASLWGAADQLRANSKLTSSEYSMPVLGVIFLRHASNRYYAAKAANEADQAAGKMPKRKPGKADLISRRAMMLPKEAQFDELLKLPKSSKIGEALVNAMNAIEAEYEPLAGEQVKRASKDLLASLVDLLRPLDQWETNQQTPAQLETLILDEIYPKLPSPPFAEEDKEVMATQVYQHVWQQSVSGHTLAVGA